MKFRVVIAWALGPLLLVTVPHAHAWGSIKKKPALWKELLFSEIHSAQGS